MTISETLKRGEGGNGQDAEPFWGAEQYERLFYNAIGIVRLATGKVSAPDLQQFIAAAATTPEQPLANGSLEGGFPQSLFESRVRGRKRRFRRGQRLQTCL